MPDHLLDASTIDALLEAVTRAGTRQILAGEAPDFRASLKRGLRWRPELFADGEHFDLPALAASRRWGDCDDLGPWYAASLRASGEDPRARARARRSGPGRWHVVTQRGDGRIVDPSRAAGMGRASVSGEEPNIRALAARQMALAGDGAIAVKRGPDGAWWCRCDLPWADAHLTSVSPAASPERAVQFAVQGALSASDGCSADHAEYADALAADLLTPPKRGSLFGSLRGGRTAVRSLLSGIGGDVAGSYASAYKATAGYRAAIAKRPGSESWWIDPLVAFLFANGGERMRDLSITKSGSNVEPVLTAIDALDGFHAGQWPAVSSSVAALAGALNSTGKLDVDRAHIQDAIGYPVSALYDARVAAEKAAGPSASTPGAVQHVQMSVPGGGHVTTPITGGSIIVRF